MSNIWIAYSMSKIHLAVLDIFCIVTRPPKCGEADADAELVVVLNVQCPSIAAIEKGANEAFTYYTDICKNANKYKTLKRSRFRNYCLKLDPKCPTHSGSVGRVTPSHAAVTGSRLPYCHTTASHRHAAVKNNTFPGL